MACCGSGSLSRTGRRTRGTLCFGRHVAFSPSCLVGSRSLSSISSWRLRAASEFALEIDVNVDDLMSSCLAFEKVWTCSGERPSAAASATGVFGEETSPAWKMMLLSDGSVTRHVELLTGGDVSVECLEMKVVTQTQTQLDQLVPEAALGIPGPVIQRQVFLYSKEVEEPCVYAVSWWNKDKAEAFLTEKEKPIWVNLSDKRKELYREVNALYKGKSSELERHMGVEGPFWGRSYVFYHEGELLTVIFEAFSNNLDL